MTDDTKNTRPRTTADENTEIEQEAENKGSGFRIKISKKPVPNTPRGVLAE